MMISKQLTGNDVVGSGSEDGGDMFPGKVGNHLKPVMFQELAMHLMVLLHEYTNLNFKS